MNRASRPRGRIHKSAADLGARECVWSTTSRRRSQTKDEWMTELPLDDSAAWTADSSRKQQEYTEARPARWREERDDIIIIASHPNPPGRTDRSPTPKWRSPKTPTPTPTASTRLVRPGRKKQIPWVLPFPFLPPSQPESIGQGPTFQRDATFSPMIFRARATNRWGGKMLRGGCASGLAFSPSVLPLLPHAQESARQPGTREGERSVSDRHLSGALICRAQS